MNLLNTLLPKLLLETWHPAKNKAVEEEIQKKQKLITSRKVWWQCEKGHEWEAIIRNRLVLGSNCPFCAGNKVAKGSNNFSTLYPKLSTEFHIKNTVSVEALSSHSDKKVWWLGKCGHEWEASVHNRVSGTGCPVCSGRKIMIGENDFASLAPHLLVEWNYNKNTINPDQITMGSGKKVWWLGKCGHEWEDTIPHRREGRGCPFCSNHRITDGYNNLFTLNPNLFAELHPSKNQLINLQTISSASGLKLWWMCKKDHEWEATVSDRKRGTGCPFCSQRVSKSELAIKEYVESLGYNPKTQDRKTCQGFELDIHVREKKIAIEFNGLYWHSERTKSKNYHYEKWLACKNQGIQLIQIWEDDWNKNPEQIKKMIAHKLGSSNEETVFARKTKVVEIDKIAAANFLRENHIQGSVNGSIRVALEYEEKLVAVMVLKVEPNTDGKSLNLIRYATNSKVTGGFTKLLKSVEKKYQPNKIITFSDHCVSDGSLYFNNNFFAEKELRPDYMYIVNRERKHKFGYRLSRFKNDPTLKYQDGLTEKELALLNNLERIWDAGKTKWTKIISHN